MMDAPPLPKGGSATSPPKQQPPQPPTAGKQPKVKGSPRHIIILGVMVAAVALAIQLIVWGLWAGGLWSLVAALPVAAIGFMLGLSSGTMRGIKVMAERRVSLDPEEWGH